MRKTFTHPLRKYAFLATLSLCASSLLAQSEDDARQVALRFMQQGGLKTSGIKAEKLTPQVAPLRAKAKKVHPTFRVIRQSCNAYSLSLKYLSSLKP